MNIGGLEIERKYLICIPGQKVLGSASCSHISQTYLVGAPGTTERVRKRAFEDRVEYTHTIKRRLSDCVHSEDETQIGREEYDELLKRADTERRTVEKDRYCYYYRNQMFEIDVYPYWKDKCLMELELESPEQEIFLPPDIRIIRDVTGDRRYTNASIARKLKQDRKTKGSIV